MSHSVFTRAKAKPGETFEKLLSEHPLATLEGDGVFKRELATVLESRGVKANYPSGMLFISARGQRIESGEWNCCSANHREGRNSCTRIPRVGQSQSEAVGPKDCFGLESSIASRSRRT